MKPTEINNTPIEPDKIRKTHLSDISFIAILPLCTPGPQTVNRQILSRQSGVLCFCLLEDGYVRVGVAPQCKEVLVSRTSFGQGFPQGSVSGVAAGRSRARPHARLCFTSEIDARLEGISPAQAEAGQGANGKVTDQAGVVNYLLKLRRRLGPPAQGQIRRAARLNRAHRHIQHPVESGEL